MSRVMFTNLAAVAAYHGAAHLARMATAIATDEGRHEVALVSDAGIGLVLSIALVVFCCSLRSVGSTVVKTSAEFAR